MRVMSPGATTGRVAHLILTTDLTIQGAKDYQEQCGVMFCPLRFPQMIYSNLASVL